MRRVSEVMRAPALVVSPAETVQRVSAQMLEAGVHVAVVAEGDRIAGLITAARIAVALGRGFDATRTNVEIVVEHDPLVFGADEPLAEAHQRMRARGRAFAAVVVGGEPIGVLEDPEAAAGA